MSFPNGCHVCEVEIDPETGVVTVVGYTAVDDVGNIIHETVVDGQTHGGIAQGLGQVLGEHVRYGEDGQLLNASLMDYALPRAAEMPVMSTAHHSVPCTTNPLGREGRRRIRRRGRAAVGDECGPRCAGAAGDRAFRSAGVTAARLARLAREGLTINQAGDVTASAEHTVNEKCRRQRQGE